MPKFVESSPSQAFLLAPDMRDWVPADDLAHFMLEAVKRVPMSSFRVNGRGTGSAQYLPRTMLGLQIYGYANGIFGSRRVERATYRDLGVRYVAGNRHPDHDTICKFQRENFGAVTEAFLQVLLMARELKLLKVETVSVDGSQLVLGGRVSGCASDRGELVADIGAVPGAVGAPERVLADNGYATGSEVTELENRGMEVLVAVGTEDRRHRHDFRPPAPEKRAVEPKAEWLGRMRENLEREDSRAHYRLRKQTVEPVFGIVKEAMGFRRFLLRGMENVEGEWAIVTLAYNCKRLNNMMRA